MLRASLLRSRPLAVGAIVPRTGHQWAPIQRSFLGQRTFADTKKPDENVLPGTQSTTTAPDEIPLPPVMTTPANPSEATPLPQPVVKLPPSPKEVGSQAPVASNPSNPTSPPTQVPTGYGTARVAPTPPLPRKKKRRFRRFLFYLTLLSGLGYAGGIYYSLIDDNFHDFFTEFVPGGEDAVGYFEEQEFRKRFATRPSESRLYKQVTGENKVTIPSKSGLSWRVADVEDPKSADISKPGPHTSALGDNSPARKAVAASPSTDARPESARGPGSNTTDFQGGKSKIAPEDEPSSHKLMPKDAVKPEAKKSESEPKAVAAPPKPAPPPVVPIDNINIDGASEPVVQDVVKILNDLITVINADNASDKYGGPINKAKSEVAKVVSDLNLLRDSERKAADDKVRNLKMEFDTAAKELMNRWQGEMKDQESRWREEYEAERERLSNTYNAKLKGELETAQKVYDQKVKNALLEQSIDLQRKFTSSVRDRVETERNGRLAKLDELTSEVKELEKLTNEWNEVIEANLSTQHLIVALEAVKAKLESATHPTPFTSELAALKEIAPSDPVVSAAIASIPPVAYQRGIPTPAYLIDRFRRVAAEVRKASLLPENAGVASHAASLVLSKVLFKKGGLPVGEDVESILGRAETLLEEGELDAAAREVNQLQGWAGVLSRDWVTECRRVLEVRQALDVIATEARLQSLLVD